MARPTTRRGASEGRAGQGPDRAGVPLPLIGKEKGHGIAWQTVRGVPCGGSDPTGAAGAEPPAELTSEPAAEWRRVTGPLPGDWFSGETRALLADYFRHVMLGRRVAEQIDPLGPADLGSEEGLRH